jgi:hypothetical protein
VRTVDWCVSIILTLKIHDVTCSFCRNMAESKIRYTVIATIATSEYVEEYKSWLSEGHIQALIDEGGALSGEGCARRARRNKNLLQLHFPVNDHF